jgi:drug/metabolite transporter (DMT)-like permease
MSHGREREGLLLLLLSAAGFGAMAVLAKLAYAAGASVPEVLTVRFALAAVVLGTLARRRPARAPLTRRSVLTGLGLGAGLYAAESGLFYASLTRLHADVAELLLYAYPGLVVAGAVALKRESFSARRGAALGVAGAGVGLVLLGGQAVAIDPLGAALALGAAVGYTAYILVAGPAGRTLDPLRLSALVCAGAAATFAVAGLATGSLQLDLGLEAWGWMIALALGSTVLPLAAFLAGMERMGAGRAAIVSTLEPPITVALAFLAFGERLAPLQLAGGLLVVGAVVVLQARLASLRRVPAAQPARRAAARTFALRAARGRPMGLRAQVGRLPGPGFRRR